MGRRKKNKINMKKYPKIIFIKKCKIKYCDTKKKIEFFIAQEEEKNDCYGNEVGVYELKKIKSI